MTSVKALACWKGLDGWRHTDKDFRGVMPKLSLGYFPRQLPWTQYLGPEIREEEGKQDNCVEKSDGEWKKDRAGTQFHSPCPAKPKMI